MSASPKDTHVIDKKQDWEDIRLIRWQLFDDALVVGVHVGPITTSTFAADGGARHIQ